MHQEVEILVNGGKVEKLSYRGRTFVVVHKGASYEIRLQNYAPARVLGVVSVDGINVIDGEQAAPDGVGYIVDSSYTVRGYRTSTDEVHPFIFSDKDQSYASQTGTQGNCGVIGVIFYADKNSLGERMRNGFIRPFPLTPRKAPKTEPRWRMGNSNTPQNKFDTGTSFSDESVSDYVNYTNFSRGHILDRFEIYYASESALVAMGVHLEPGFPVRELPSAFSGFCKPPKTTA